MATIGKVSAIFSASTSGLKAGVADASRSFKKMQGDVAGVRSSLATLTKIQGAQLFGSIASAAMNAGRSLLAMSGAESETIDQTSKLARRLGMTYGELAGLSLAGNLAGVSMDTIGKAATKADIAFVKASQGSSQAQAAFAGIGLSVEQLQGLSPAERFQKITDAIAGLPTEAERARASVALFGKSGAELLPLFEGGAGGIQAATDEAKKFGLALTNEQGQSVENMNDAFTRAYQAISGVVQQVVAYLAPALEGVTTTFTDLIGGVGGANIGAFIGEAILNGAAYFAGIADWFVTSTKGVWEYVAGVVEHFGGVTGIFSSVVSALQSVWYLGEAVFKGVGAILAQSMAGWAGLLAELPETLVGSGWQEFGKSMETSAATLARGAEDAGKKSINSALNVVGMGDKSSAGEAKKGPLALSMAEFIAKSRADAAAKNAAAPQTIAAKDQKPAVEPTPVGKSMEALKAVDSRSKEGIAEMFRLQRGASDDTQERIVRAAERTADAVEQSEDPDVVEFAGT
jgi:hypothetical protein